ncbi:hypothetical protein BDZ94DRAFT_1305379 [Collybia nuda]|uniref:Mediator of RNA polymerase II transcription subunit 1 n=1 Tax=Collybia nuda TaxID=64659 RepID=A0A9P6CP38_9AGAR|nr:hypothetical protein BDZ94DRAFT_1305379 [Collybia nuda]
MNHPPPQTLLSTIQRFQKHNILPNNVDHSFASSAEESCTLLQDLINATDQVANSLDIYSSTPWSNPKLVSLLRQHSSIVHRLYLSDAQQIIDALRKRSGSSYGEDVPLDPRHTIDWCVSRLETWGTSVGMETFKDDNRESGGGISVVLGGKVLVVDVDFSVDALNPQETEIKISRVKTSYAISNSGSGTSNSGGSISLDAFLKDCIQNFCSEVRKPEASRSLEEAARLGTVILDQLRYLVMLDRLAARKEDNGLKWFTDVDQLCPILEDFAKSEAEVVASSLGLTHAPLDIFLLRSHTLPLPFLVSPSISFLTYVSPSAYLSLLKNIPTPIPQNHQNFPQLDIPLLSLRSHLLHHHQGVTIATLSLSGPSDSQLFPASMSMPNFITRPTFPLDPRGSDLEHVFPQLADLSMMMDTSDAPPGHYVWILDFTNGGKRPGVVMSQSRMRDIELVVNPLGGMDDLNSVGMMSFGTGSWVDLLLNTGNNTSPERYTAIYKSPTSIHPPLQLRLTTPEEPGFRLDKVPVHSMKEVWGILEVVREQCWLNGILSGCDWTPEGLKLDASELPPETEATEDELQAVLSGNITPRKIPVNVFLPLNNIASDPLFGTPDLDSLSIPHLQPRRPKIVMTSPERPPISGLVEITIIYDETKPRGISVEVSGAMGSDMKPDVLEEICRRGGGLGLSGRVWSNAHVLS